MYMFCIKRRTGYGISACLVGSEMCIRGKVELLLGDPTKAEKKFGWTATTSFDDLVKEMVTEDLKMAKGTIPDPEAHKA